MNQGPNVPMVVPVYPVAFDAGGEWNMVRLYSNSSDKYSDENPMMPGFGAAAGIIALLSAALIARRD